MIEADWNSGPGNQDRHKRALSRQIDEIEGHWIWNGRLNIFGSPVVEVEHVVVSAAHRVYRVFRGTFMPEGATRQCEHVLCVKPGCFATPKVPPKGRRKARTPRSRATTARVLLEETGGYGLQECFRGHVLAETRRRTPQGVPYCGECSVIRAKERYQLRKEARDASS